MTRWVALLLTVLAGPAFAMVYEARMDEARWTMAKLGGECRLAQRIPGFGEATFISRPGERIAFTLTTIRPLPGSGIAYLQAETVLWKPDQKPKALARTASVAGKTSLILGPDAAAEVLSSLQAGWQARISQKGWYPGEELSVVVSPVRLADSLDDFLRCTPRPEAGHRLAAASRSEKSAEEPGSAEKAAGKPADAGAGSAKEKGAGGAASESAKESTAKKEAPKSTDKAVCEPVAKSPSQELIRQREEKGHARKAPKPQTLKKSGDDQNSILLLAFPAGKTTMSKETQDALELVVKEWQTRSRDGRSLSVKIEAMGGQGLDDMAKERATLARNYLIKRGVPEARVHARVESGKGSVDEGKVSMTLGD